MSSRFERVVFDNEATLKQNLAMTYLRGLEQIIEGIEENRLTPTKQTAFTKLEELSMWIHRQIRDDQLERERYGRMAQMCEQPMQERDCVKSSLKGRY